MSCAIQVFGCCNTAAKHVLECTSRPTLQKTIDPYRNAPTLEEVNKIAPKFQHEDLSTFFLEARGDILASSFALAMADSNSALHSTNDCRIQRQICERNPHPPIVFKTSEDFIRELISFMTLVSRSPPQNKGEPGTCQ